MPRSPRSPKSDPFQTIDPTKLGQVAGGASRKPGGGGGGDNSAVLEALSGIASSLSDLAKNRNQGFGPTEMMMFAMIMSGRNQARPTVVAQPSNPYGAGYFVDGVFHPFK